MGENSKAKTPPATQNAWQNLAIFIHGRYHRAAGHQQLHPSLVPCHPPWPWRPLSSAPRCTSVPSAGAYLGLVMRLSLCSFRTFRLGRRLRVAVPHVPERLGHRAHLPRENRGRRMAGRTLSIRRRQKKELSRRESSGIICPGGRPGLFIMACSPFFFPTAGQPTEGYRPFIASGYQFCDRSFWVNLVLSPVQTRIIQAGRHP